MTLFRDLLHRLALARRWVAVQFIGNALLILLCLAWTRLPDRHAWQVALTLLIPVLLAISALELHAATMRRLADDDGRRVKLVWGALTLLAWLALAWAAWWLLDLYDDHIWTWAGYLNSKAPAHARATWLSFERLTLFLSWIEWIVRWIALPGKLIPLATASAQWGWRLRWRLTARVRLDWRWWLAVVPAALLAVALPARFFAAEPAGAVSAQVWHVGLKLAAAYMLAVTSWVCLLAWAAVLFAAGRPPGGANPPDDDSLVPVPVLAGPTARTRSAKEAIPPPDEEPTA